MRSPAKQSKYQGCMTAEEFDAKVAALTITSVNIDRVRRVLVDGESVESVAKDSGVGKERIYGIIKTKFLR